MTAEQKQRAADLLSAWRATAYALHGDAMADLLQEMVDAPEVLPATNPAQISSSDAPPAPAEANDTVNMSRDCEHGSLARSCQTCDLQKDIIELRAQLDDAAQCIARQAQTIARLLEIEKAARNLAKVRGRHNSELAMNQLLEALK